jgi:hypothetical protein
MLIIYIGFKDIMQAKHLERLEVRLKGMEPVEFDKATNEPTNEIVNDPHVDLSLADPEMLARYLDKKVKEDQNQY